jgi:proteasome lid subunit RPN8/RPN11
MQKSLLFDQSQKMILSSHLAGCLPEEGCGLIAGRGSRVEVIFPITNVLHSPTGFEMDAQEELDALIRIDQMELDLIAYYHSHPNGPLQPSPRDIEEYSLPGAAAMIWSRIGQNWRVKAFNLETDPIQEVEICWIENP